ncbi:MAG: hypothetical protein K0S70_125 [Microbacterium sp.]|jgi:hypothetical protein|nr:hypothetical protein [Microbacterium sp.]
MGVWSGGPSPTSVDIPGIAAAMRPALEQWMTGHIQIVDLKRGAAGAANAFTDVRTNTEPVIVLDSGPNGALIQPMRAATRGEIGGQPSGLLGVRFQVKRSASIAEGQRLRGGLAVRVLDGGNAAGLVGPTYALPEVLDSSLAWDYIFEAVVVAGGS